MWSSLSQSQWPEKCHTLIGQSWVLGQREGWTLPKLHAQEVWKAMVPQTKTVSLPRTEWVAALWPEPNKYPLQRKENHKPAYILVSMYLEQFSSKDEYRWVTENSQNGLVVGAVESQGDCSYQKMLKKDVPRIWSKAYHLKTWPPRTHLIKCGSGFCALLGWFI